MVEGVKSIISQLRRVHFKSIVEDFLQKQNMSKDSYDFLKMPYIAVTDSRLTDCIRQFSGSQIPTNAILSPLETWNYAADGSDSAFGQTYENVVLLFTSTCTSFLD